MVTISDMKDRLLTLDDVYERIAVTEPLSQKHLSSGNKISFAFEPTWHLGVEQKNGTDPVDAVIRVDGTDHQLTKDAALLAGVHFGLPGKYAIRLPHHLLEEHLNYWYGLGMSDHEFNMLSTGSDQTVAGFARPTINPFSNRILIDEVIAGIRDRYGNDVDIYADYKFNHSLLRTDVRFIVPEVGREVTGGGLSDVPSGEADEWSGGVHLTNSLMGKSQTKLETYLFRWWCTNGATSTMDNVGVWSRRGDADQDVYEWARDSVDEVLGGLEGQFDAVQRLTALNVEGHVADIVKEIYDTYGVPVSQRKAVHDTLLDAESLTIYTIMNAITQTANEEGLSPDRVDKLLRITGSIPQATFSSDKARVFREGQEDPEGPNPYEITAH